MNPGKITELSSIFNGPLPLTGMISAAGMHSSKPPLPTRGTTVTIMTTGLSNEHN
jgi:hypothetical protein